MNARNRVDSYFWMAFFIGLAVRLAVVPFTMTDEADAVTRIFITQEWMRDPGIIYHGVWGPLQTYFIALSLVAWDNPVYSPVILNCIFSAAAAIPLYYFVKREWDEKPALFAACLYLVYPVAFRYGFFALSDVPFIFFISLGMLLLSLARDAGGNWKHAALAGITVTLAGALRYEAWGLTPFLGLLLWKKWREMFLFYLSAAVFPVFWMTGNYLYSGDPFYSFNFALDWTLNISQNDVNVSTIEYVNRATYFPRVLFFGLTPIAFLVCILGMFYAVQRWKKQTIWLLPLAALFGTFTINAVSGKLSTQVRYSLTLAIFMIPFAAEWFERMKESPRRTLYSAVVIASMIPLGFLRAMIPWQFDFPNPIPRQVSYLPRLSRETVNISTDLNRHLANHPGGLILDFYDWGDTYYIALMTGKHKSNIYMTPGEVNEPMKPDEVEAFLLENPKGVVLLTETPRFLQVEAGDEGPLLRIIGTDRTLHIREIGGVEGQRVFAYSVNAED